MRTLPDNHYIMLKTATQRLLASAGGVESAARMTRVGKSVLSDYANLAKPDCFMPIDVALDLTVNSSCRSLFEAAAILSSHILLPVSGSPSTPLSIAEGSAKMMSETADVLKSTARALADSKVTPRERRDITTQIQQAISACVTLLSTIKENEV